MKNLAVLVLAAGASSRMQTPKQLLQIGDKTLLELVLAKAVTSFPVFCVLGANANLIQEQIINENVQFIINKNYKDGLSSSIVIGIEYLKKTHPTIDGVLILLADQPAIETEYLKQLVDLFSQNKKTIIASKYPKNFGVPAIFPNSFFDELCQLKGDSGAKDFLQSHRNNIIFSEFTSNLIDLDTKDDYEKYTTFLKKSITQ